MFTKVLEKWFPPEISNLVLHYYVEVESTTLRMVTHFAGNHWEYFSPWQKRWENLVPSPPPHRSNAQAPTICWDSTARTVYFLSSLTQENSSIRIFERCCLLEPTPTWEILPIPNFPWMRHALATALYIFDNTLYWFNEWQQCPVLEAGAKWELKQHLFSEWKEILFEKAMSHYVTVKMEKEFVWFVGGPPEQEAVSYHLAQNKWCLNHLPCMSCMVENGGAEWAHHPFAQGNDLFLVQGLRSSAIWQVLDSKSFIKCKSEISREYGTTIFSCDKKIYFASADKREVEFDPESDKRRENIPPKYPIQYTSHPGSMSSCIMELDCFDFRLK
jgi:hypothetical protein